MKILMYGWEFPPHISGGLGVACYGMVTSLIKKSGVNVTLVLPHVAQDIVCHDQFSLLGCRNLCEEHTWLQTLLQDINITEIDTLLHPYITEERYHDLLLTFSDQVKRASNSGPFAFTGKYGPNLMAEVYRYAVIAGSIAKKTPHDVIHAHDWLTGLAGIEAKKHSKKPLIFHIHALERDRCGENVNQQVFAIEKQAMEQADLVIAVSQYTKSVAMQYYGIPEDKIFVVHNGISPKERSSEKNHKKHGKKRSKMILFLGRITHQKGPYFFIEAAKKILSKRKDVHFVIAGTGDLLPSMIEHVAQSGVAHHVHFTGFVPPAITKKIYQMADLYVMPSVSEPFGLTALEALSQNIPILISKQSGAAEVLQNVLTVDYWNIIEMASKMCALLDYPVLRETTVNASKKDLDQLTWDNAANKLVDVYQQAINL